MKKLRKLLLALVVLAAVAGGIAYYLYDREEAALGRGVVVSGNIEVVAVELSFQVNGRVDARPVDEGDAIEAGQEIAVLDMTDLKHQVALRQADVAQARAALDALENGSRPQEIAAAEAAATQAKDRLTELLNGSRPQEIAGAEAEVQRAKAEARRLKADEERARTLYADNVVSRQQYDGAYAASRMAQEQLDSLAERYKLAQAGPRKEQIAQARAALKQAEEKRDLVVAGPREEDKAQGRARLEQAQAALALAETQLGYGTLHSTTAGVVLSKATEPGEYVVPGTPVVTVGDITHVFLRAYIDESDLGRVKLNQKVEVTTDSYPGKKYMGVVSFIAPQAEFTPKSVQTQKERVKLVYRVKVDIDNPARELKPGMPADAVILTD